MFSKNRHLRGLKSGSGNSDSEYPERTPPMSATSVSSEAAANDGGEQAAEKSPRSWPFAYALGLALVASAVLWAAIAAVIHYF